MPTPDRRRFWVYARNADGELIEDIVECDKLRDAVDSAVHYLTKLYPQTNGVWVHVVDNLLQGGTTVWIAGPGNSIQQSGPVI